jgi:3alpha(or 20beta)-hydroxysteroid dehydrogenase
MTRFADKVFLISGGSRGLGAAQAKALVAQGAKVVIGDLLEVEGNQLAAELGAACVFQRLDVTDEMQWAKSVSCAQGLGKLHGLVNNAGVLIMSSMLDTSAVEFDRLTRINQMGTFLGMKSVVPALEQNGGGTIVNLSSVAGLRGTPNALAYSASKWAVRGMTKAAALELAPRNIRVNSVHPGPIDTDMMRGRSKEETQSRIQRIPMKRFGKAEEIAGLVLFLLSDESRYMTGSEVAMDGGISL